MRRLALLWCAVLAAVAGPPGPAAAHPRAIDGSLAAAIGGGTTLVLRFPGFSAPVRLRPEPVVAPDARFTETDGRGRMRDVPREPFATFAGEALGSPRGTTRLTAGPGWISGIALVRGRWFSIEPDDWNRPRRTVVTEATPVDALAESLEGDVVAPAPATTATGIGAGIANCSVMACNRLDAKIVLDGDYYFRALGSSTCQSRQTDVFNSVKAIYASDTRIRIDLTASWVNCRTTPDLGTSSSTTMAYLEALRGKWNAVTRDRSAVHLAVGFAFAGTSIGLAYNPGVCSRIVIPVDAGGVVEQSCPFGYSLYQWVGSAGSNYTATPFLRTKLAAHELGHNFDADHDSAGCGTAPGTRTGPIMCPFVQEAGPNTFSSTSATTIRRHAESTVGYIVGL